MKKYTTIQKMTFSTHLDFLVRYQQIMSTNYNDNLAMDLSERYLVCEEDLNDELVWAIKCQQYSTIREMLSKNEFDPNTEIDFGFMYMTALEFAIITCDWKMALLFFVHGADPYIVCCDGCLRLSENQTNDETTTDSTKRVHPSFQKSRLRHLIGFERLRSIVPEDMAINDKHSFTMMHACLWLMEIANGNVSVSASRDASTIWNIFIQITADIKKSTRLSEESTAMFAMCLINIERFNYSHSRREYENKCMNSEDEGMEDNCNSFDVVSCALRCIVNAL